MEAAQSIPNALPNDKSVLNGQNEATWLAQQAKAQGFTVMRMFGIADVNWGEGSALQTSAGVHCHLLSLRALQLHAAACLPGRCSRYCSPHK